MGHADRTHALLSPSGAYQWLACPPSALLQAEFPDTSSGAAEEGTLAHELAELKVRNYCDTVNFGKRKLSAAITKLKKHPLWDEEMMRYTDDYLDYVRAEALAFPAAPTVAIEKRFDLGAYIPGSFGTADCVLIGGGTVHVIDFKYGKSPDGRVLAERNPQMMLYALGAYEAYHLLYPMKRFRMSIVQPRLTDGISEWECTLDELLKFGAYVKERAALAMAGKGEYHPDAKTCRYCRARGKCRARAEENVRLAFMADKKPPLLSNEEVGDYLAQGEDVAKWLGDLKDYALAECLAGRSVPGWKAVEGRGSREWTDMDAAFSTLEQNGVAEALLWERKPLSLAQVEKTVGKKEFETAVGRFVRKVPGKPALVKESDKREAITNKITAAEAFKGGKEDE